MLEGNSIMNEIGYPSYHYNGDEMSEELQKLLQEVKPDHLVFPILQMKSQIPIELLNKTAKLYVGVTSDDWLSPYRLAGFEIFHYLKEVRFIWENARLTAEAFIQEYFTDTKSAIAGTHFYIAGFGRVGKMTAEVLTSLGGSVTILVRSDEQLGEAEAFRYGTERLAEEPFRSDGILINTIPAKWLEVEEGSTLRIFDLSSAPGCLKDNSPDEYYTIHLGLPGKHFPVDAARALTKAILRMNSG